MITAYEGHQTPYQLLTTINAEALREWAAEGSGPTQTLARLALNIDPIPELSHPLLREVGAELDPTSLTIASDVACGLVERASGKLISVGELTVAGFFRAADAMLPNLPSNGLTKTNARVLLCAGGVSISVLLEAIPDPTSKDYIDKASMSLGRGVRRNSFRSGRLRHVVTEEVEQVLLPSPDVSALHPYRLQNLLTGLFGGTRLEGLVQEAPASKQLAVLEALFDRHREQRLGRLKFHELGGIWHLWQYCEGLSVEEAAATVARKIHEFKRTTNSLVGRLRITSEDDLRGIGPFLEGEANEVTLGPSKALTEVHPDKGSMPRLSWSLPTPSKQLPLGTTKRPTSAAKASTTPPPAAPPPTAEGKRKPARSSEKKPPTRGIKRVLGEVTASLALSAQTKAKLLEHIDERTEDSIAAARLAGVGILPFIVAARDRGALSQLHFETAVYFFGTRRIAGRSLSQLTTALAGRIELEGDGKSVEKHLLECCEAWLADAKEKQQRSSHGTTPS